MMRRATLPLAALAWVLGCGSDTNATGMIPDGNHTTTGTRTIALSSVGNSSVSGSATVTVAGDSTTVIVSLMGAQSGNGYPAHIHDKTCAASGGIVVPLMDVVAGQSGAGMSTTVVATKALDDAQQSAGGLLIMAHFPDGTPCACGDLPWPP